MHRRLLVGFAGLILATAAASQDPGLDLPARAGVPRAALDAPSPAASGSSPPASAPINAVIGDVSFAAAFGDTRLAAGADETLRIRTHLAYVERLLRARDVRALSADLQAERRRNLDRLHAYREQGVFPRNFDHPEARRPCFIDRDGRICAVGHLIEQSAGRSLAEAVNSRFQYALVSEMEDAGLTEWIRGSGLSATELALIQPQYGPFPAGVATYGTSCAPPAPVPAVVVDDPVAHFRFDVLLGGPWDGWRWWLPPPANAHWIAPSHAAPVQGPWRVRKVFDLPSPAPASASVTGLWSATPGSRILLNGTPSSVTLPGAANWTTLQPFTIASGFVPGRNVLEFEVPQDWYGACGLLVASLSGTVAVGGTSQPVAGLFQTGVDGQGVLLPSGAPDLHYPSNEPPLRAVGYPVQPNPRFGLTVDTVPNRLVLLALSNGIAQIPIGGGCEILIPPTSIVTVLGATGATGRTVFPLPIPRPMPWYVNQQITAQAVVEDAFSSLGLSLTQRLEMWTGW